MSTTTAPDDTIDAIVGRLAAHAATMSPEVVTARAAGDAWRGGDADVPVDNVRRSRQQTALETARDKGRRSTVPGHRQQSKVLARVLEAEPMVEATELAEAAYYVVATLCTDPPALIPPTHEDLVAWVTPCAGGDTIAGVPTAVTDAIEHVMRDREDSRMLGNLTGARARATDYVRDHATHPDGPTLRRWRGGWYRWSSATGCYREVTDERIDSDLYRSLGLSKRAEVGDIRHALIAVDDVLIDETDLGAWVKAPARAIDPLDVAAAPNGLINLATGDIMRATPSYFSTNALGVRYRPNAPTPAAWLEFLAKLWGDDHESIAALQEWFGLMLTPDTRQQKILLLVGPKRSGKGTIMRVLTELLGRDSVAAPTLAGLGTNFGLQPLIGRTAAIIGDARLSGRTDVAQVVERLLSISGQDPQTIDRKHRESWTGYLSTRIALVSNELPRFADASGAIASRMLTLSLTRSFLDREDTTLMSKLLPELPGILLWAIEGWRRLRERGRLVQPASSHELVDQLADLASPVAAWIRDQCTTGEGRSTECKHAYSSFAAWCGHSGHHTPSRDTFGRDIQAAGYARKRVREGKALAWHYVGFALASAHAQR